jgi:protein involved in polysaccharide export with SLBB domain
MNPMKMAVLALASLGLSMLAACASAAMAAAPAETTAAGPTTGRSAGLDDYRLDSGDALKITVYNEPTLSGPFMVDGQGDISMPLIGEVTAKNLTVRELQRAIEAKLRDGFVREPQVSAEVVNYRPYYILGEINQPGEFPYISGLTVMNAIASAGDFTYRADKRRIFIKRVGNPNEEEIELTPSTPVRPGDTIRIRERLF